MTHRSMCAEEGRASAEQERGSKRAFYGVWITLLMLYVLFFNGGMGFYRYQRGGTFLLNITSGRLVAGGVEYWSGHDESEHSAKIDIDIPPGSYALTVWEREFDSDQHNAEMIELLAEEDWKFYNTVIWSRAVGCLPILACIVLAFLQKWHVLLFYCCPRGSRSLVSPSGDLAIRRMGAYRTRNQRTPFRVPRDHSRVAHGERRPAFDGWECTDQLVQGQFIW